MSFFQDFNKVKKQSDLLEMKDLNLKDAEAQINKLHQMAQARVRNFERVCTYIEEEIIQDENMKKLDQIPSLVREAKGDLEELLRIIKQIQEVQVINKTLYQNRQQQVQKLTKVFTDLNDKLKKTTDKLQRQQQTSLQSAKQSLQRQDSHSELQIQLLDQQLYDEQFVERRQKQINEIAQVVYQLNQMMTDAAEMIQNQGIMINEIGMNIAKTKGNVKAANEEMNKAQSVQKGNNGKMYEFYLLSLFFCGVTTLIVVIIVLLFSASSREHPEQAQPT